VSAVVTADGWLPTLSRDSGEEGLGGPSRDEVQQTLVDQQADPAKRWGVAAGERQARSGDLEVAGEDGEERRERCRARRVAPAAAATIERGVLVPAPPRSLTLRSRTVELAGALRQNLSAEGLNTSTRDRA